MPTTGLDTFDTTIQETNHWLKVVMTALGTDNRRQGYAALRVGLHALRDRIGQENAVHFGAQLPMLLRGLYYEGWKPSATPTKDRHLDDFLSRVESMLTPRTDLNPADALCASFATIAQLMPLSETLKVINTLPQELRVLWPGWVIQQTSEARN